VSATLPLTSGSRPFTYHRNISGGLFAPNEDRMTPRQRVLTALQRGQPDRVPWIEGGFDERMQVRIMDGRTDFTPGELCRALGMDGFGFSFPSGTTGTTQWQQKTPAELKESYYFPKKISFDFRPPWIAEMGVDANGRAFVKRGLLVDRDALALFDEYLPDPDHAARYEQVARWIEQYREDFAVYAGIRLGTASTIESMGLDVFALALYDDPDLVKEVHRRYAEWCVRVVENLNKLDFDYYWAADDIADTKAPWVNLEMYEEFIYPYQKMVADAMRKPWAYHSDGNLFPVLDGLLRLGMNAIHPIQPSAMDLGKMKAQYGRRVCIIGNIDLDYTLTLGPPEGVEREVKERIAAAGKGGGYIISSGNSITDYCKPGNVWAMASAVKKYGQY
jgi:uroporphyrinogen decarboxylase-like protein